MIDIAPSLIRHRMAIKRLCERGLSLADVAERLNETDELADASDETVLQAAMVWRFERPALPAGHVRKRGARSLPARPPRAMPTPRSFFHSARPCAAT